MSGRWPDARAAKFRQAAFVYLHLGILYEAATWVMWREGILPTRFGPPWVFMVLGGLIVAGVFAGLYRWQNVWVARAVWLVQAFRFPALIKQAFFVSAAEARLPPAFYITAMIIVVISMWALARAGWDV
ncbi:MAG: hypothetical protein IH965_05215 [Gemmatimonadetes bacterium]|nr:hypothetical protein [Gemmatimonadota bacterium]